MARGAGGRGGEGTSALGGGRCTLLLEGVEHLGEEVEAPLGEEVVPLLGEEVVAPPHSSSPLLSSSPEGGASSWPIVARNFLTWW